MTLQAGEQFDHYQIRSHIARGGTGDVYDAVDVLTGRAVALKIPMRETIVDPRKYQLFLREVQVMGLLEHPAVQHKVDSGNWHNTPFLVTDLVDGPMLRTLIETTHPFPIELALALTCKIADGLAYCHAQGVVHRDLKPENVHIAEDDQPVIMDFGLAITPNGPGSAQSAGTPDYMAPEQIEGRPGDKRTDIYALGTMLFEMLAGAPPFASPDLMAAMQKRMREAVPRLDQLRQGVSPAIATVVARCLQRDPDARYPDMQSLIADLDCLDQVDASTLEALCAVPARPTFFRTLLGQAIVTTGAFIIAIAVLTVLLLALKR